MSASAPGALYGIRIAHVAALASTCREPTPIVAPDATFKVVATYARATNEPAFRVVHDMTVNRPYGRFAVYIGERRLGAQLSFPSEADCRRMESPPALLAPYEKRLSLSTRMALGVMSPAERAIKSERQRAYYRKRNAKSVERGIERAIVASAAAARARRSS